MNMELQTYPLLEKEVPKSDYLNRKIHFICCVVMVLLMCTAGVFTLCIILYSNFGDNSVQSQSGKDCLDEKSCFACVYEVHNVSECFNNWKVYIYNFNKFTKENLLPEINDTSYIIVLDGYSFNLFFPGYLEMSGFTPCPQTSKTLNSGDIENVQLNSCDSDPNCIDFQNRCIPCASNYKFLTCTKIMDVFYSLISCN